MKGRIVVIASALAVAGACGSPTPDSAAQQAEQAPALPASGDSFVLSADSAGFLAIGDQVRNANLTARAAGTIVRGVDPVLSPTIDITKPGEYRIPIQLPAGTDTDDLLVSAPGDAANTLVFELVHLSPDGEKSIVDDGAAEVVLVVSQVKAPYLGFRVWVY